MIILEIARVYCLSVDLVLVNCFFQIYLRDEASFITCRYAVRRLLFSDPKIHDLQ